MSKAQQMVSELERIVADLEKLGNEFVEHFPSSSSLYRFANEIGAAHEGMAALLTQLQEAVQTAKNETAIKENLLQQIKDEPVYKFLDEEQSDRLAEYLVQNEVALATTEELLQFIVKSIKNLDAEQTIKNLSKEFVTRMGGDQDPGDQGNDFDAYSAGVSEIKRILEDSEEKEQFIGILAREYMKRNPELAVKKFYSKVGL